jgi:hypothetical protein
MYDPDVFGVIRTIQTKAYYVPAASIWLFSPQVYFQDNNDKGNCHIEARGAILHMPDGTSLKFPYDPHNNLPMMIINKCGHNIAGLLREDVGLLSDPQWSDRIFRCLTKSIRTLRAHRRNYYYGTNNLAMQDFNGQLDRRPANTTDQTRCDGTIQDNQFNLYCLRHGQNGTTTSDPPD